MNVIISADSAVLYNRITSLLAPLADVHITGVTKDLTEADAAINKNDLQVLVTALHKTDKSDFKKLSEIKTRNAKLVVIVLTTKCSDEQLRMWRKTGADYVFDQAIHLNKIVDILSGLIYKNLLEVLKSSQNVK